MKHTGRASTEIRSRVLKFIVRTKRSMLASATETNRVLPSIKNKECAWVSLSEY